MNDNTNERLDGARKAAMPDTGASVGVIDVAACEAMRNGSRWARRASDGTLWWLLNLSGYPQRVAELEEENELLAAANGKACPCGVGVENERLRAENARLTKLANDNAADAGRYRWLRQNRFGQLLMQFGYTYSQIEHWSNEVNKQKLDASIDLVLNGGQVEGDSIAAQSETQK